MVEQLSPSTECVPCQDHQKALAVAYQKYSMLDPVAGKPSFGLEEWKVNNICTNHQLDRLNPAEGAALSLFFLVGALS